MRVDQLWRYPVKSVGGEQLAVAAVGAFGVDGDRILAVRDQRGEVTWAGAIPALMQVRAVLVGAGVAELILPDGQRFGSAAAQADRLLGGAVGETVALIRHRPDNPDTALHVVTTTSLRRLGLALPGSTIDASRFRPNLVLDGVPDEGGNTYPEHAWIGRRVAIGAVRLRFTQVCDRCVMITKRRRLFHMTKRYCAGLPANSAMLSGCTPRCSLP
jgi:MOSC domain-containing protein